MEKNPQFLKLKYDLHQSPEAEDAARHTEQRNKIRNQQFIASGQEGPLRTEKISSPEDLIQTYIYEILRPEDPEFPGEGLPKFKKYLHDSFIITPEAIPESVFLLEKRIARERGESLEITEEFKQRKITEIINDQKQSLDKWIEYLSSPNAQYPDWAKYWAMRSVLDMGKFKKEQTTDGKEVGRFQKRTKDTVAVFAPCNPRALAETVTAITRLAIEKTKAKKDRAPLPNQSKKLADKDFRELVSAEDFSRIYTQFLIELPEYSTEGLQEIRGKWVKYKQGSDPKPLVDSLEGYPLEWCTAGYETAKIQLEGGDFYVYYSRDQDGEEKIPRVAIRMTGDTIAEVRGIAPDQNTDPYITPVIEEKMKEFGVEGEKYKKRSENMKYLTAVEEKMNKKLPLTRDDLIFLYEIDAPIEGFGNQRDTRIAELQNQRTDMTDDISIIFECSRDEVAYFADDINEDTKVYVGPLFPNIFKKFSSLENIYTSFPEGRIRRDKITIGGKDTQQLEQELEKAGFKIFGPVKAMMKKTTKTVGDLYGVFTTQRKVEVADLVCLTVGDLGFSGGGTTDQIYQKAEEFGLELCPAEVGPQYRLAYTQQPMNERLNIAMQQISDPGGYPRVFSLCRDDFGVSLEYDWAGPRERWNPEDQFVFRLPKQPTLETSHPPASSGQHQDLAKA